MRVITKLEMKAVSGAGPISTVTVTGHRLGSNFYEPGGDYSEFTAEDTPLEAAGNQASNKTTSQAPVIKTVACVAAVASVKKSPTYKGAILAASTCSDALQSVLDNVDWQRVNQQGAAMAPGLSFLTSAL